MGKTVMAGVMGGGLGAMFGLFMASVCCFFGVLLLGGGDGMRGKRKEIC